jgi:hypothetical protein
LWPREALKAILTILDSKNAEKRVDLEVEIYNVKFCREETVELLKAKHMRILNKKGANF